MQLTAMEKNQKSELTKNVYFRIIEETKIIDKNFRYFSDKLGRKYAIFLFVNKQICICINVTSFSNISYCINCE